MTNRMDYPPLDTHERLSGMKIQEAILYSIAEFHLERLRAHGELRYARAWYMDEEQYADSQSLSHSNIRDFFTPLVIFTVRHCLT